MARSICCGSRWNIRTAKINGVDYNPDRWEDGSYSIQGAAKALGITEQTVFKWLKKVGSKAAR